MVLLTLAYNYWKWKKKKVIEMLMSLCLWVLTFLSLTLCSNPSGSSVSAPLPIIACPFSQSKDLILFDFVCSTNVLSFFWFPHWPPRLFSHIDSLSICTCSIALNSFSYVSPWGLNFLPHLIPVSYPYCCHVKVFHFQQFVLPPYLLFPSLHQVLIPSPFQ